MKFSVSLIALVATTVYALPQGPSRPQSSTTCLTNSPSPTQANNQGSPLPSNGGNNVQQATAPAISAGSGHNQASGPVTSVQGQGQGQSLSPNTPVSSPVQNQGQGQSPAPNTPTPSPSQGQPQGQGNSPAPNSPTLASTSPLPAPNHEQSPAPASPTPAPTSPSLIRGQGQGPVPSSSAPSPAAPSPIRSQEQSPGAPQISPSPSPARSAGPQLNSPTPSVAAAGYQNKQVANGISSTIPSPSPNAVFSAPAADISSMLGSGPSSSCSWEFVLTCANQAVQAGSICMTPMAEASTNCFSEATCASAIGNNAQACASCYNTTGKQQFVNVVYQEQDDSAVEPIFAAMTKFGVCNDQGVPIQS